MNRKKEYNSFLYNKTIPRAEIFESLLLFYSVIP
nr:MAG TPA: hypothetical protein [Caudoviricetes sp.]